jgi:hypothetical protein
VSRHLRRVALPLALFLVAGTGSAADHRPVIRLAPDPADPKAVVIEVAGLDARAVRDWPNRPPAPLTVCLLHGVMTGPVPVLAGACSADGTRLIFRPKYPLLPGKSYWVSFNLTAFDGSVPPREPYTATLTMPAPAATGPAAVTHVYPSGDALPENLLRFYVHFSTPMRQGEAFEHIRLLDAAGKPVERPFLELAEELWDDPGCRLTILLDPGRIKRGLVPHEEQGLALVAGNRYTLEIDAKWRDAAGRPLAQPVRKVFRVEAPERDPIDPKKWALHPPAADSREPLEVRFPKPLDHALLRRVVRVADAAGRPVAGEVAVDEQERRWRFTPAAPWAAGAYRLTVGPALEDRAGNRVGRPFDAEGPGEAPPGPTELPFNITTAR